MKILILGASGTVGRRTVFEALARGHHVTAAARNLNRLQDLPSQVVTRALDIGNRAQVAQLVAGQAVVVNATRPAAGEEQAIADNTRALLQGMASSGARLMVVGGAARLKVPDRDGRLLLDDPRFLSPHLRPVGEASLEQYRVCQEPHGVDVSYLSPPAELFEGERTGSYRIGRDELLLDAHGRSRISIADLVVAMLDEIERPGFRNPRFTVAY
ncbi:NAD(P)-dependent oxidoreductase [Ketobacter sp.]|uniref:NAD(P)-dependent oxidoreductase n=1 Tax=Ketobacter sp. TaxID=2083498 RepID=UPI000F1D3328|nr:NAD(P)H-binding protein [Ketobacter sp.]RLT93490.1 MAG: NAD-dependent epimerase/dehydratase family protein [Ketobacter sp.]